MINRVTFFITFLLGIAGVHGVVDFPYDGSIVVNESPRSTMFWKLVRGENNCMVNIRLLTLENVWVSFGYGTQMSDARVFIAAKAKSDSVREYQISDTNMAGINRFYNTNSPFTTWRIENDLVDVRAYNLTRIAGHKLEIPCPEDVGSPISESFVFAIGSTNSKFNHKHLVVRKTKIQWASLSGGASIDQPSKFNPQGKGNRNHLKGKKD